MGRYLGRRALRALASVWAIATVAFILSRLAGSPASQLLGPNATRDERHALDHRLGLDRPLLSQYWHYLTGLARGDFGDSYSNPGTSSMRLVFDRLPSSATLGLAGLGLGVALAFAAVLLIHLSGSTRLQSLLLTIGSVRQSLPDFLFGVGLVAAFSVSLGWLPSVGNATADSIILPALTIATSQFVLYLRLASNSLGEQGSADYVRTAYARGESRSRVVLSEMLPNALLPVLTFAGINLGGFLGGLVIVENVFAWPGLGQLMLNSVDLRDFPVVQSGLIFAAVMFIAVNLLVDLLYGVIDPRVRVTT